MYNFFKKIGEELYSLGNNHTAFKVNWKLISPICKKWSGNREPDMNRVREIEHIYKKGEYFPPMIHLAYIDSEGLVCYDGNHRRCVFDNCKDDEITCIVDVMFNATSKDIYDTFNNLNKSVSVPSIYLSNNYNKNTVKVQIIELVSKYEKKYKSMVSSSSRCRSPNFNRDNFIENIYEIYKSFDGTLSIDEIERYLDTLNSYYANGDKCRPHSSYSSKVIDKCKKNNLWLFLDKTIPTEHIHQLLS